VREIVVFSGSAHRRLARSICAGLDVPLSRADITRFSNDCLEAQLQANCRQRDVYIVQPLVPPTQEHLMELLLMIDAARGASAAQVTAVIPYFAYARSNKKDASRISLGGRLVADLLVAAGANKVLTMTLHAPQVHGFFSVPVDHLTALGVLADHFSGRDLTDTVVVSPDLGNAKTATQFARLLGLPVAAGSKQRLADDRVVIEAIVGDVRRQARHRVGRRDRNRRLGAAAARPARGAGQPQRGHRLHPRPVHGQSGRATQRTPAHHRGRHHRHRAAPRGVAGAEAAFGGRPVRRGHQSHSCRRVRQQPVRRRRPGPRTAAGQAALRRGLLSEHRRSQHDATHAE